MKTPHRINCQVNNLCLSYELDYSEARGLPCRCQTEYLCPTHHTQPSPGPTPIVMSNITEEKKGFPTTRRPQAREIDRDLGITELEAWAKEKCITLGPLVPNYDRLEVLQVLWTYRGLESTGIRDMGPATDLIKHRIQLKPGTPIYRAKVRKYAPEKEWWFRKFVTEGIEAGMYERTVTANGRLSPWGADAVVVPKPGKPEPRLTFNYHFVFEVPPANHMELAERAHRFLSAPSHKVFSQFDLKNAYWGVEIHPDDRQYFAFNCPGYGQLQPTRMPQGARSSSFTMNELGNILFGDIPPPNASPSLLSTLDKNRLQDLGFYIDDTFMAHESWDKHWRCIRDHYLPRLEWGMVKLSFGKIKIGMAKIIALGEVHEVGGRINIKPDRVKLLLGWPLPTETTDIRSFLGTAATTRRWVKNYSEVGRPLSRLTGSKVPFSWGEAEQVSFDLLRNLCATAGSRHGWIPHLPCNMYTDASKFAMGCYLSQHVDNVEYPLFYDSMLFTQSEQNYDTYKRELKAIVTFVKKHGHYLQGPQTSTIYTDHKPLVGFLNSDSHEDIFARWAQTLRLHNIKLEYIKGERNQAADGLSRTIFNKDCESTQMTKELHQKLQEIEQSGDREWIWKTGKGGYSDWLKTQDSGHIANCTNPLDTEGSFSVIPGWITMGLPVNAISSHGTEGTTPRTEYDQEDHKHTTQQWYGDLISYYRHQKMPDGWTATRQAAFKRLAAEFRWDTKNFRLMRRVGEYWVTCIAPHEIAPLLQRVHDKAGHFNPKIVLEKIRYRVWWPRMQADIHDYIKGCIPCVQTSAARRTSPLSPIFSLRPFYLMAMDLIGPLPKTTHGNTHILTVVDYFSRFLHTAALDGTESAPTIRSLTDIFHRTTIPLAVYADQGRNFISLETQQFFQEKGVKFSPVPSRSHRSAGMIEITNRILQNRLITGRIIPDAEAKAAIEKGEHPVDIVDDDWDERLGKSTHDMNHRHMVKIGYSPVEIYFGASPGELQDLEPRYPRHEIDAISQCLDPERDTSWDDEDHLEAVQLFMTQRTECHQDTIQATTEEQAARKSTFEAHKPVRHFEIGDYVFLHGTIKLSKLHPPCRGPFKITNHGGEHGLSWKISTLAGEYRGQYHNQSMFKFHPRQGYLALPGESLTQGPFHVIHRTIARNRASNQDSLPGKAGIDDNPTDKQAGTDDKLPQTEQPRDSSSTKTMQAPPTETQPQKPQNSRSSGNTPPELTPRNLTVERQVRAALARRQNRMRNSTQAQDGRRK